MKAFLRRRPDCVNNICDVSGSGVLYGAMSGVLYGAISRVLYGAMSGVLYGAMSGVLYGAMSGIVYGAMSGVLYGAISVILKKLSDSVSVFVSVVLWPCWAVGQGPLESEQHRNVFPTARERSGQTR